MTCIAIATESLRRRAAAPLVQNLFAYGASEAASKATRLLVVIAMARTLGAAEIGLAATALAASEILKALTQNGVGERIIAAPAAELESVCAAAHRLYWIWCGGLFLAQAGVGAALFAAGGDPLVFAMILALGVEYLFMPAGLVQCFLAMREGRLKATAAIGGAQVVVANVLTAPLLLVWPSPLAVILPKVASAPFWLFAMRRLRPWRPAPGVRPAPLRPFLGFGAAVLGVEVVKALRLQADKLIIGALLGAEALGVWFFAVNAGLGLANSFSVAFAIVAFPHFCAEPAGVARTRALRESLALSVGLIAPAITMQAILAPVYVPLVFGGEWAEVADLVAILCLAAIPGVIWTAASQWLRAHDRAGWELNATVASTLALVAAVAVFAPLGLDAVALAYVVAAFVSQLALSWPALRPAFRSASKEA